MRIIFLSQAFQKMRTFVMNCEYEISGLGKITRDGDNLIIEDIQIFTQTVSPVETKLSADALGRFYNNLMEKGEDIGKWRLWWHSHAKMKTFWSQVDVDTINDFDNEQDYNNWMLSVENNHNGDLLARIDVYSPFRCSLLNLDVEIDYTDTNQNNDLLQEMKEKITIKPFPVTPKRKKKAETDWAEVIKNMKNRQPDIGLPSDIT